MSHNSTSNYPLRPCPYCQNDMPNTTKSGRTMERHAYNDKKACASRICQAKAHSGTVCPICDGLKGSRNNTCSPDCGRELSARNRSEKQDINDIQRQALDKFIYNREVIL